MMHDFYWEMISKVVLFHVGNFFNYVLGKTIVKCFLYGTQKKTFPWALPFREFAFPSEKCFLSPVAKANLFRFVSLMINNIFSI